MSTISILVTLPSEIHKSIEENCLARNIDFNQYFIDLLSNKISQSAHKICEKPICEAEPPAFIQNIDTYRQEWIKEGQDVFKANNKRYRFAKMVVELIEQLKPIQKAL